MFHFLSQLLDWIYKKNCYLCHKTFDEGIICDNCYNKINIFYPEAIKNISGIEVWSACSYENEVQKLIRGIKYHNKKEFAQPLAKLLYEYWQNNSNRDQEYLLVPVPLHKKRQKSRGYNHMELVAIEFTKLTGYETNFNLVKRIRDTKPQYKLTLKERRANLQDAFSVDLSSYNQKPILLLDDISTTGSTFEQIIKKFQAAGVRKITALSIAMPVSSSKYTY